MYIEKRAGVWRNHAVNAKFSRVSVLQDSLYEIGVELTFEKFRQWMPRAMKPSSFMCLRLCRLSRRVLYVCVCTYIYKYIYIYIYLYIYIYVHIHIHMYTYMDHETTLFYVSETL